MPVFNKDRENDRPEGAQAFLDAIERADAVLLATPEYNSSIPGGPKNALDWASRPFSENVLRDKPSAVAQRLRDILALLVSQAEQLQLSSEDGRFSREEQTAPRRASGRRPSNRLHNVR